MGAGSLDKQWRETVIKRTQRAFGTKRQFAVVLLCCTGAIGVAFIGCWFSYDEVSNNHFGFSDQLAAHIAASYSPVIGASASVLRSALFDGVGTGKPSPPLIDGSILYAWSLLGVIAALAGIFYVATDAPESHAKWAIGAVATFWAATVGYVLSRYFSKR